MSQFYFKSVILISSLRSFTILFCVLFYLFFHCGIGFADTNVFNKFCSKVYYNDIEKIWFLSKQFIV